MFINFRVVRLKVLTKTEVFICLRMLTLQGEPLSIARALGGVGKMDFIHWKIYPTREANRDKKVGRQEGNMYFQTREANRDKKMRDTGGKYVFYNKRG